MMIELSDAIGIVDLVIAAIGVGAAIVSCVIANKARKEANEAKDTAKQALNEINIIKNEINLQDSKMINRGRTHVKNTGSNSGVIAGNVSGGIDTSGGK